MSVDHGPPAELGDTSDGQQVVTRRGNVDAARPQLLAVAGMAGGQRTGSTEDLRKPAARLFPDVHGHQHACRQISW
jgi:hypothetical protein